MNQCLRNGLLQVRLHDKTSTPYGIPCIQRHLQYLALSLAAFSGVIVVASLNLALASGVLSLLTVGDPLSIAFSRFFMPQSGFTVNVLLNDSVGMATSPYGKSIS